MSASTVAITTNPTVNNKYLSPDPDSKPSTRRRRVVVAENKSTTGVVVVDGGNSGSTGREAVLERPQESSPPKKNLIEASTVPTRRKKSTLKPEKPRWQTVFSIVLSDCLPLTVVLWLGWVIWRYDDRLFKSTGIPFSDLPSSVADLEGRVSDAEASLKATERMMQVELENLNRKLAIEIGSMRGELKEQIEEKSMSFGKDLEKFEMKVESFGKSLADLWDSSFLTHEEFRKLLNDHSQSSDKEGRNWSLDEIRIRAREVVMGEIERHAADGLGRVDYALASGGARVVRHSEPYDPGKRSWLPIVKGSRVHADAHKMLEPSFGEPGQCFPLLGNTGFVEIKLRTAIILHSVTLEHVAKSVAYDRSSAPRDCRISAWLEPPGAGDDSSSGGVVGRMLTVMEFTYELEKSNAQTFNTVAADAGAVNVVRLDFSSNHGSSSHTCIYRLRVHGFDSVSLVTMAVEA